MSKLLSLFTLVASLSIIPAFSLRAQMVLNGSFEVPALVAGAISGGAGDNWGINNLAYVVTNTNGLGLTSYGAQWELIYNNSNIGQVIRSGFTLNIPYTLSLAAADVNGIGSQLTVTISGAAHSNQTFILPRRPGGSSSGALPFATYTLDFVKTNPGPVFITLANTGVVYLAVDNVHIVPEPSTWALLLGGAGLFLIRNRRRQGILSRLQ